MFVFELAGLCSLVFCLIVLFVFGLNCLFAVLFCGRYALLNLELFNSILIDGLC